MNMRLTIAAAAQYWGPLFAAAPPHMQQHLLTQFQQIQQQHQQQQQQLQLQMFQQQQQQQLNQIQQQQQQQSLQQQLQQQQVVLQVAPEAIKKRYGIFHSSAQVFK